MEIIPYHATDLTVIKRVCRNDYDDFRPLVDILVRPLHTGRPHSLNPSSLSPEFTSNYSATAGPPSSGETGYHIQGIAAAANHRDRSTRRSRVSLEQPVTAVFEHIGAASDSLRHVRFGYRRAHQVI